MTTYETGWINDPEAVKNSMIRIMANQGPNSKPRFWQTPAYGRGTDDTVCLWEAERKIFGSVQNSWDQGKVGTCVSFGYGRGCNDCLLLSAARGDIDKPESTVATEPIYAGSRVEVGRGQITGDGSVGAWAAEWLQKWGVLLRKKYNSYDLTSYSESRSREWGRSGVPNELENLAKQFPVKTVTACNTFAEAWDAIGSGYPVAVCSNQGFTTSLDSDGFCSAQGNWGHCMLFRGRVIAKKGSRNVRALICQNSWGNYLNSNGSFVDSSGKTYELPEGSFCVEESTAHRMLSQDDSHALSDVQGFPKREPLTWLF
jgi:hypothetical protein